jgi:hypothetical protein
MGTIPGLNSFIYSKSTQRINKEIRKKCPEIFE